MHARTKTTLAAIAITALAVVGTDAVTYAGTGDSLILGKLNKAGRTTHVTSTGKGPALSLHAKGNRPALAVDSNAKIVRLNADRVDGREATSLQNNVRVYTARTGSSFQGDMWLRLPSLPKGRYLATYSAYLSGADGSISNPTLAACYFSKVGVPGFHPIGYGTTIAEGWPAAINGSGVIVEQSGRWQLFCTAHQHGVGQDEWTISSDVPVKVTLTRIDKTIGGKLSHARTAPPGPFASQH